MMNCKDPKKLLENMRATREAITQQFFGKDVQKQINDALYTADGRPLYEVNQTLA